MRKIKQTTLALCALIAVSTVNAHSAKEGRKGMEKCSGIVAKHMNDCGTSKHTCAGQATLDKSPEEWMYVPVGTCKKIAGGNIRK